MNDDRVDFKRSEIGMQFKNLAQPGKIGSMWLKNRLVQPAMETWSANPDGTVSEATVNHYRRRADGGVGLIITEMTNPTPGCRCFPGELEISEDKHMIGMSRIADAIHSGGAKAAVQLCHGGVFARGNASELPAYTPSGIGTFSLPGAELKVMTKREIQQVVEDYGRCAQRAKAIGFDAVELHCGHGYLQVEFLSAYYNQRTDEYGGSVYNRCRFSLEIVDKIHEYCGKDFPIIFKLSAEDYVSNGITIEQSIEIAKYMEEAGVDAIMVSGGTLDSRFDDYLQVMTGEKVIDEQKMHLTHGIGCATWIPSTYCPRNLYSTQAAELKKDLRIPVITVGAVTPENAEEMLSKGEADFAALGRQILADPDYPKKLLGGSLEDIRQCLRCNECLGGGNKNRTLHCAVNPSLGQDLVPNSTLYPAEQKKRIAVIGSGPAGLNAAIAAKSRGHEVVLYEKDNRLGGLMYYVGKPDFKSDYRKYTDYLIHTVQKLAVDIRLQTLFTEEVAQRENFDQIIAATGSEWFLPNIEGAHSEGILSPLDVLDGQYPEVEHFLICGAGLVGCEVAMFLAEKGKKVTLIDIVPNSNPANLYGVDWSINARLQADHVKIELEKKILKMTSKEVVCPTKTSATPYDFNTGKGTERPYDLSGPYDGATVVFQGDAVICALGMRAVNELALDLLAKGYPVEIVGDAQKARKILDAVHEGYHAGRRA